MKTLNQKAKQMLREPYEKSCNDFLLALIVMWHWDNSCGYWVGDDVGGVYAYGDWIFIDMSDIIFCVENDIEEEEYIEWQEYSVFASEYDQTIPNFQSWHKGCPRLSKEQQEKLIALKKNLNDCIEEYKEQVNQNNHEKINEKG